MNKRVLSIVVAAVVICVATKVLSSCWCHSAANDFEKARECLTLKQPQPDGYWDEYVRQPMARIQHYVGNLPAFYKAMFRYYLAEVVDSVLVWVVIALLLFKVLRWSSGRLLNAWVDGRALTKGQVRDSIEYLPNGDIIVHVGKLRTEQLLLK